jgi:hypothetical protein
VQTSVTSLRDQRVDLFVSIINSERIDVRPNTIIERVATSTPPPTQAEGEVPVGEEQISESANNNHTLPGFVRLDVPFTSQAPEGNWDQPWQDACEEAAILMMDAYYKEYPLSPYFARDELMKLVNWQVARGWGGSIDIEDIQTAAMWYMQREESEFSIIRNPKVDELQQILAAGHPILAVADGKTLPNPYFSGDGPTYHALVIIGYDAVTGEFITHDPGTRHGKDFRYAYDDLMSSLRDWNDGNVKEGMPVVLVKR